MAHDIAGGAVTRNLKGKWLFHADRREYMAVVYSEKDGVTTIVDVACEQTKHAIKEWLTRRLRGEHPLDMYDRKQGTA